MINKNPKGQVQLAHIQFRWYGTSLNVTVSAARPADSKSGQIGIGICEWKDGKWNPKSTPLWNRNLSNKGFEQIKVKVSRKGMKIGAKYLMIFYKMNGTEAAAISDVTIEYK